MSLDSSYEKVFDRETVSIIAKKPFDHSRWLKWFQHYSQKGDGAALKGMRRVISEGTISFCGKRSYVDSFSSAVIGLGEEDFVVEQAKRCRYFDFGESDDILIDIESPNLPTLFSVELCDCLVAEAHMRKILGLNPCVLNMASAGNPGGGWLGGAGAQEENLFRRSNYFEVLIDSKRRDSQRSWRYPIHSYAGIYSPSVFVFRSSEATGYRLLPAPESVSFVAVAAFKAPELVGEGQKGVEPKLSKWAYNETKRKIRALLKIVIENGHDSVLSALGCGAYRNPPTEIARAFREVFLEPSFRGHLRHVAFAIFDDHNAKKSHNPRGNFIPFKEVFSDLGLTPLNIDEEQVYLTPNIDRSSVLRVSSDPPNDPRDDVAL